jgi:alkanesulfonate monooxygenase SsuD/methylene tetrahydromethanopterin reductase-like flavin-dependent oxidoreductase (luciferase family)
MGTPDQVADDIARYAAAGVEHLVLRFATGGPETTPAQMSRQLVDFAREVVPQLDPTAGVALAG